MKNRLLRLLYRAVFHRTIARRADRTIGPLEDPYMLRWWLVRRNRWCNIYAHWVLRDDDDRALHDHPWISLSIILAGGYVEVMPDRAGGVRRILRPPGSIVLRRACAAHRLELPKGKDGAPHWAMTLFITGPKVREWGFLCPQGWRHWREFTVPGNSGLIGRGCDEERAS